MTPEMAMDVAGFDLDDAETRLYLSLNDRGYQRVRVHDARTLAELKVPVPADAAAVTVGSLSRDGRFAVVGVDSGKAPRTSFVIDWQTGSAHRVGAGDGTRGRRGEVRRGQARELHGA